MNDPSLPNEQDLKQNRRQSDLLRLESWKAIANYFNRSVRTVRRWESNEQLPVHRHKHANGSSVYAYESELEAWKSRQRLFNQEDQQPAHSQPVVSTPRNQMRTGQMRTGFIAGITVAAIALMGLALLVSQDRNSKPVSPKSITVLIATPIVFGGGANFGTHIDAALRRDLSSRSQLRIATPKRLSVALTLMRHRHGAELTAELALNIAQRDGEIDAIIVPQVEQIAGSYVLSAEIINASNGDTAAFPFVESNDERTILASMKKLAQQIDGALGQLPTGPAKSKLAPVTTASLAAVQHYSQALLAFQRNNSAAADDFLELALREDPDFVSAATLKAWIGGRQDSRDTNPPLHDFAARASDLPMAEQLLFDGISKLLAGEQTHAKTSLSRLLEIDAENFLAAQAMLGICLQTALITGCEQEHTHYANLRPDDFESNYDAAFAVVANGRSNQVVTHFTARLLEMIEANDTTHYAADKIASVLLFEVVSAWNSDRADDAWQQVEVLLANVGNYPVAVQQQLLPQLANVSALLGRVNDSRMLSESIYNPTERYHAVASSLFAAGEMAELKLHLAENLRNSNALTVLFMTMTGKIKDSDMGSNLQQSTLSGAQLAVIDAMLAAQDGNPQIAIEILQDTVATLTADDQAYLFVGRDMLSKMLFEQGKLSEAIEVLEGTTAQRTASALSNSGLFWMLCQRQLANLYRADQREWEATMIEDQLRNLLSVADDRFPLSLQLRSDS